MFGLQAAIVDGWRTEKGLTGPSPAPTVVMTTQLIVGAVALVVVAWLAACAEAGLARTSSFRAEEAVRSGRRGSAKLAQVAADPTRYLNVALLVRVGLRDGRRRARHLRLSAASSTETWQALTVAIGVMVLVSYVAVGVSPRTIGRQHPLNTATAAAYVLLPLARVMGPVPPLLILIGNALTPGKGFRKRPVRLRGGAARAGRPRREGVPDRGRGAPHGALRLRAGRHPRTRGDGPAHRPGRASSAPRRSARPLTLALRSGFSRIPVTGENEDDVVGIVYLKDLVRKTHISRDAETELVSTAMRPAVFVPDTKNAGDLLREMQQDRNHVAVVIDEYGGTAGIVTIEDILEEIVGEITDEYDRELPPGRGARRRPLPGHRPPRHRPTSASCTASRSTTTRTWRPSAVCWPRPWAGCRSPGPRLWSDLPDGRELRLDRGGRGRPPEQDRDGAGGAGGGGGDGRMKATGVRPSPPKVPRSEGRPSGGTRVTGRE